MKELIIKPREAKEKNGHQDAHDFVAPGAEQLARRAVDEAAKYSKRDKKTIIDSNIRLIEAHMELNRGLMFQARAKKTIENLKRHGQA